jgi:sugar-specific transcriptional regulator TrmB
MIEKKLQSLGLSEKEAKTYLAALELGATSVMEISKKASLKRPTTYYAIGELIKKGLISTFEKGKKTYFVAESPERLISLVTIQKRRAAALEEDLAKILPALNRLFELIGERPRVRFFEGKEGIRAIQEDILKSKFKTMEEIVPLEEALKVFPRRAGDYRQKIREKIEKMKIKNRVIYTAKKAILPSKEKFRERKHFFLEKLPLSAEIVIYGKKIAIVTYKGKLMGLIVESEEIASSLRAIFDLAWQS